MRRSIQLLALLACLCLSSAADAAKRVALVIGNSAYQHTRALPNAANDATAVSIALERIGFGVTTINNLGHAAMVDALRSFGRKAADSEMAVIFYAGHGLEVAGENWLVPVSAELRHERDLNYEAVNLKLMLEAVAGAARLRLVILDACRNNPLGEKMKVATDAATGVARAVNARGLGRVEPTGDVLVVYSAKHGTTAEDGPAGGNSPFASALLEQLPAPGLDVRIMFGRVIDQVRARTGGRQEPFTYGSVGGAEVSLVPGRPSGGPSYTPPKTSQEDRAVEAWRRIEHSKDQRDFEAFKAQFGAANPFYAREAEKRIAALDTVAEQTALEKKRQDELHQKEEQLKAKARELEEARLKLKEDELRQRAKELEAAQERVARAPDNGTSSDRSLPSTPVTGGPTLWNHNGSTMRLVADGSHRRFIYDSPRQGMRDEGVTAGTVLFDGNRNGERYSGTAYVFSGSCGLRAYRVQGTVSADQRWVTLRGQAPRLATNCAQIGSRPDELVFELLEGQ